MVIETKTNKGEQTRTLILETALEMFRERGYEETTMRAISEKANISLGNTYYYFRSKEHLIQAFYGQIQADHLSACQAALANERTFKGRLLSVMQANLKVIAPYHRFAMILFKTAADPESPLNPFSTESQAIRQESIKTFTQVVHDSRTRIPPDLKAELPELLWLYHMGITLFWIHDRSPECVRTQKLITNSVELVAKLVSLASLPLMKPLRRSALNLLASLKQEN